MFEQRRKLNFKHTQIVTKTEAREKKSNKHIFL